MNEFEMIDFLKAVKIEKGRPKVLVQCRHRRERCVVQEIKQNGKKKRVAIYTCPQCGRVIQKVLWEEGVSNDEKWI